MREIGAMAQISDFLYSFGTNDLRISGAIRSLLNKDGCLSGWEAFHVGFYHAPLMKTATSIHEAAVYLNVISEFCYPHTI